MPLAARGSACMPWPCFPFLNCKKGFLCVLLFQLNCADWKQVPSYVLLGHIETLYALILPLLRNYLSKEVYNTLVDSVGKQCADSVASEGSEAIVQHSHSRNHPSSACLNHTHSHTDTICTHNYCSYSYTMHCQTLSAWHMRMHSHLPTQPCTQYFTVQAKVTAYRIILFLKVLPCILTCMNNQIFSSWPVKRRSSVATHTCLVVEALHE